MRIKGFDATLPKQLQPRVELIALAPKGCNLPHCLGQNSKVSQDVEPACGRSQMKNERAVELVQDFADYAEGLGFDLANEFLNDVLGALCSRSKPPSRRERVHAEDRALRMLRMFCEQQAAAGAIQQDQPSDRQATVAPDHQRTGSV